MATVDVIIALYNGEKWIRQALESVFQQTYKPGNILVIDDGSTDLSLKVMRDYPQVTVLQNPVHGGSNSARNYGLRYSKSDFVAFLDQDDLWHPEHLALLIRGFADYPQAQATVAGYVTFWEGKDFSFDPNDRGYTLVNPWDFFPSVSIGHTTSALLFRREAFMQMGAWPVEHSGTSDYSCWLKMTLDYPGIQSKAKTAAFRRHRLSALTQMEKDPLGHIKLWIRVGEDLIKLHSSTKSDIHQEIFLRSRLLVYQKFYLWMASLLAGDELALKNLSEEIEQSLNREPPDFINAIWIDIHHTIWSASDDKQKYREYLKLAFLSCSSKTPILRGLFIEKLIKQNPGKRFYLNYFLEKPWEIYRLEPFIRASLYKATAFLKR